MTAGPRRDDVVDDYHGTKVADPYRWLEDGDSDEVRAWTEQQNARTRAVLDVIPGRYRLHRRLTELIRAGTLSAPAVRRTGDGTLRYFHFRREGGQDQVVYYVRDGDAGDDRPLIDVAGLSDDGSSSLAWTSPSPDGSLVAWGRSEGGSEESTLQVRDVESGQDLGDVIPNTRLVSIAWRPEGDSFFYTRYPRRGSVAEGEERYGRRVFLHRLGTDPEGDPLVFPDPSDGTIGLHPAHSPSVALSPDGRWLVVRVHQGAQKSEVYLRDLTEVAGARWAGVATGVDARFLATPRDDRLYILTNQGAPRSRLFAVSYHRPERAAWREILPEGPDILRSVAVIGDVLVATYLRAGEPTLERFSLDGRPLGPLALPPAGSVSVHGRHDGREAFVHLTSFVNPGEVLRFDLETGRATKWARLRRDVTPAAVEVTRRQATSRDGTRVLMFVAEREGTRHDGSNPAILTGYGGFNQCALPAFSPAALAAVERGAVWVTAAVRGGGELGDEWHRAGMQDRKQNVFDDFVACAEELVRAGVTSPARLGIAGSSNGGLLTAAAVTQRPELFRAALCDVPLTDMLRYQHFRMARLWVSEYGSSDDPAQFQALYAYSPYHRVRDGVAYPSVLLVTAENDSRVDPMHARKMAARLQEAQDAGAEDRPILLRVELDAGHGAGKPVSRLADELTDEIAFLLDALGCPFAAADPA